MAIQRTAKRKNIYISWHQNSIFFQTLSIYSLRIKHKVLEEKREITPSWGLHVHLAFQPTYFFLVCLFFLVGSVLTMITSYLNKWIPCHSTVSKSSQNKPNILFVRLTKHIIVALQSWNLAFGHNNLIQLCGNCCHMFNISAIETQGR